MSRIFDASCEYVLHANQDDAKQAFSMTLDVAQYMSIPVISRIEEAVPLTAHTASLRKFPHKCELTLRSLTTIDADLLQQAIDILYRRPENAPALHFDIATELCVQMTSLFMLPTLDDAHGQVVVLTDNPLVHSIVTSLCTHFRLISSTPIFPRFPPELSALRERLIQLVSDEIVHEYRNSQQRLIEAQLKLQHLERVAQRYDHHVHTAPSDRRDTTHGRIETMHEFDAYIEERKANDTETIVFRGKREHSGFPTIPPRFDTLPQNGPKQVRLSELGMRVLSPSIGQFVYLTELDLSHNRLKTIDRTALQTLGMLRKLCVDHNLLERIDWQLPGSLKTIDMSHNAITAVVNVGEQTGFSHMTGLVELSLAHNKLHALEDGTFSPLQTVLERLDISGNEFRALPKTIAQLSGLRALSANRNQIQSLDLSMNDVIMRLDALESLSLDENRISRISGTVFLHRGIKKLKLNSNGLETIENISFAVGQEPHPHHPVPKLEWLSLEHNRLEAIPKNILQATSETLERLDISHNQFATLPAVLGAKLKIFNATHNRIESEQGLERVGSALKHVDLSHNQLRDIPCVLLNAIAAVEHYKARQLTLNANAIEMASQSAISARNSGQGTLKLELRTNPLSSLPKVAKRNGIDWCVDEHVQWISSDHENDIIALEEDSSSSSD